MLQKALRTVLSVATAVAVTAVAASITVVALAMTLYALLLPRLGSAGSAAGVAGAAALLGLIAALIAVRLCKPAPAPVAPPQPASLAEVLMSLAKDKPIAAGGVATAAALLTLIKPQVIGVILRTVIDAWPTKTKPPKGRA